MSEALVQKQLDLYNAQDLDAYCACFAPDVIVADVGGAVTTQGREAYRARYAKAFADFPKNKAQLLNRIVLGAMVIDHERVDRGTGAAPFEVAAIYSFKDGLIARVDFAK
ncbi:MAG: nuclear transport factor 2 family protein [Hyphomonadaceae bacterium]